MSENKHNTEYEFEVSAPLLRPGMKLKVGPVSEDYVVPTAEKIMNFVREINSDDSESFEDVMKTIESFQSEAEYTSETVSFDQWISEVNRIAEDAYEWQINFEKTERWEELYEEGVSAGKAIPKVLKDDADIEFRN